ncbi:hypothetical protein PRK78_000907 [Emydomyces testavorans]|uniref:Uncharacterized protein n=1 Tax=Emydomyces testavorans TaxID=2070801 RepID=A0AAF0DD07_9EURO|nr:hypothetical protein PRK78_000907 [Emydomyces testavorans]
MGIPLEYVPKASSRAEQNSKPDPSAAARSSIRRQNAVRRPRRNGPSSGSSRNSHAPSTRWPLPHTIEAFTREAERESSDRDSRSARTNPAPTGDQGAWNSLNSITRLDVGQQLLGDTLRYSSLRRRMRRPREPSLSVGMPTFWYGDFPPPVPPVARPRNPAVGERPSLTPRFAPAHPVDSGLPSRPNTASPATVPNNEPDSNMPLLRRVGHRSVANASERQSGGHQVLDGLGDRERSVESDDDELHDSWETLLTTITPDDQLPSLDSSFTSATASASSALSRDSGFTNSADSAQTPLSSIDPDSPRLTLFDPFLDSNLNCEFPSSDSDSDTEPESEPETAMHIPRTIFGFTLPASERRERGGEQDDQQQGDGNDNETPVTSTDVSFSARPMPSDLQEVHAILDRLVRRDDIPDEWWATAGLSRTIRRELSNTNFENRRD